MDGNVLIALALSTMAGLSTTIGSFIAFFVRFRSTTQPEAGGKRFITRFSQV